MYKVHKLLEKKCLKMIINFFYQNGYRGSVKYALYLVEKYAFSLELWYVTYPAVIRIIQFMNLYALSYAGALMQERLIKKQ